MKLRYKLYKEASISYFSVPFFWSALFFKNISTSKTDVNQCCLPPLSFNISLRNTSFDSSLNSLGFSLFRMLVEFSLTCILHYVWEKIFNLWCLNSKKMHFLYVFLLMLQSPTQNSRSIFLKICFPQNKRGRGNYDLLYQNSIRKYEDDLEH